MQHVVLNSDKSHFNESQILFFSEMPLTVLTAERIAASCFLTLTVILSCKFAHADCSMHRIIHTIRYNNCQPKRVLSYACSGTCTSYTKPSRSGNNELDRFCECCQEEEERVAGIPIRCPNADSTGFNRIIIRVKIPIGCRCRPCAFLPNNIIAGEQQILSGMKRGVQNITRYSSGVNENGAETILDSRIAE